MNKFKDNTAITGVKLHDADWTLGENVDGLYIKNEQYIPDEFLTRNRDARFESKAPSKDFHHFASIPVAVVEKWLKEGFDIYREPVRAIIKRLKQENLEAFLTSNKSL